MNKEIQLFSVSDCPHKYLYIVASNIAQPDSFIHPRQQPEKIVTRTTLLVPSSCVPTLYLSLLNPFTTGLSTMTSKIVWRWTV